MILTQIVAVCHKAMAHRRFEVVVVRAQTGAWLRGRVDQAWAGCWCSLIDHDRRSGTLRDGRVVTSIALVHESWAVNILGLFSGE
jgi:hypothetical protein